MEGQEHEDYPKSIGIDDSRGVETKTTCEDLADGELVPTLGEQVPVLKHKGHPGDHVEHIDQHQTNQDGEKITIRRGFYFHILLKLEINKRLKIGGNKLIEGYSQKNTTDTYEPEGQRGKPKAVAAFEARGEPMDCHAESKKEKYYGVVGKDVGYLREVPVRPYLMHHLTGCIPCHLVGFGRIKVRARAEEKTSERDEDEGDENGPAGG